MPWKVTCVMDEREKLVHWYETGRYTVTQLASHFGVSRKTVHKWLGRYDREGRDGLTDRSQAAQEHPNATPPAVVEAVLRAKEAHPTWGPLKLFPGPAEPPEVGAAWPAPSTRGAILARYQLVQPRRYRKRVVTSSQPLTPATAPNRVWCTDLKGWFRTGDGQRCDPLTISDAYSRLLLGCQIVRPTYEQLRPVYERTFREYGLPAVIRSDNGPPFASLGAGGLSRLAVWWIKLGIRPERIAPAHPEQNGSLERFHRTLKAECCDPPAATPAAQQARFDRFRPVYNEERPHQALGQVPPASRYTPSLRLYPARLADPGYPEAAQLRRIRSNGEIKWRGGLVFISTAVVGELVAVVETALGWQVHFGPVPLGILDPQGEKLLKVSGLRVHLEL